jgi:hypothetical protein
VCWYWHACILISGILLVVARRPDAILLPQFYGEDGSLWFADAYNHGWLHSLLWQANGYFALLPRLAAGLALLVPFHLAPLMLNVIGILVQVLPASFLISQRGARLGTLLFRFALSAAYLLLPNAIEIHATVTNAQWHAAVLLFLVLVCPAVSPWDPAVDAVVIILAGMTGPFSLVLMPIAAMVWKSDRTRWGRTRIFLLAGVALAQALSLMGHMRIRENSVGASLERLLDILGGNVFLGAVMGYNSLASTGPHRVNVAAVLIGFGLLAYFVLSVRRIELTLFVLFSLSILGASLYSPVVPAHPAWEALKGTPGGRYWFFPTLAFTWSAIWCSWNSKDEVAKFLASVLLLCMPFAFALDFKLPAYDDLGFRGQAIRFERAPVGERLRMGLLPRPEIISISLVKR